jgi:glycosyltransferase involved in cell wall biosynthesis
VSRDVGLAASVVVCTRDRARTIGRCIASILASEVEAMELLVVDQSDDDATQAIVMTLDDPRLRYLRTPTRGLARARNIGIEASRAPIILFTDDDCYVEPSWVAEILNGFQAAPRVDAVYGRVLPHGEGRPGMVCRCLMEDTRPRLVEGLPKGRVQRAIGHGNNMAFRRACFSRHGLFLEWLGAGTPMKGGEDTDFSFRILRAGARIYYSPAPLAYHDNWMPIQASNRQIAEYRLSAAALLTRFVLRGSLAALRHHISFFGSSYEHTRRWQKRNERGRIRYERELLQSQIVGIGYGLLYAFRRSPRYALGQRTRPWTERDMNRTPAPLRLV